MRDRLPTVLFLCVHNAGRSQIAAAFLEREVEGKVSVLSAGSEPADKLNPAVIEAMAEEHIDLANRRPKVLSREMALEADVVVTMGCGDTCPIYPGKSYIDWELPDPAGKTLDEVRAIRDEIRWRVEALAAELVGPVAWRFA
jgi:arsenate reductase (thioredoxin)